MLALEPIKDRLAIAGLGLFLLSIGALWHGSGSPEARAQDDPPTVEQPTPPKRLSKPVGISFSLDKVDGERATVYSACALPPPPEGSAPVWKQWVTFDGKRLVTDSSEPDSVPAYAVRTPEGAALCVSNRTDGPAQIRVNARLPRGVFTIEHLEIDPAESGAAMTVRRLRNTLLNDRASAYFSGTVPSSGVAVYRWVNRTQQALRAFRSAKQRILGLKSEHASQYRALMAPYRECESNVAVIARGIGPRNRYSILKHVHRAILTASHAQALSRNLTGMGRIDKKTGDALTANLETLDEALSELSIACLGLAPNTIIEQSGSPGVSKVTVLLTNSGSRAISFVRIGALGARTVKVKPEELATFGEVRPGETAKAEYTVRCGSTEDLCGLSAHIGYLAGKSPVRLRLRPII